MGLSAAETFPLADPSLLDGLDKTHQLVQITPFEDPSLAYAVILPKNWVMVEDMGEQLGGIGRMVRIGLFGERASGAEPAIVQVSFRRMPFAIDVWDWIRYQSERTGVQLTYGQYCDFAGGPGVDVGGYVGEGPQQHIVRARAQSESARIFVVMGMASAQRYEEEKRDIAIATHSFKLLHPGGSPLLERILTMTLPGEPAFAVSYPASWEPTPVPAKKPGKSGLDLSLTHEDETVGYVRVKVVDTAVGEAGADRELLNTASFELQEAGIRFQTTWMHDEDEPLRVLDDLGGKFIAGGELRGKNLELRCGYADREGVRFVVTMVGARRAESPLLWMRTKYAYKIALASTVPARAPRAPTS